MTATYALEREYKRAQKAVVICMYIIEHGSIDYRKAMEITGTRNPRRIHELLLDVDGVMALYKVGSVRHLLRGE